MYHRNDRGAELTVVTDYLEWSANTRMDPGLFRPPPGAAHCKPDPTGELFVAMVGDVYKLNPVDPYV